MTRHRDPKADELVPTVPDDAWTRVTAAEEWETTPAADSAANARWN